MQRKHRRRLLLTLLLLVYGAVMLFGGCANRFILYPSTQPIDPDSARRAMIDLPNGERIECFVDRSPGAIASGQPAAFLIEFTGNATRAEEIASFTVSRWKARPIECWAVNYPGYGQSSGPATLDSIGPAALAVYDHLANQANGRPIFVAGNSLGTAAALHIAANRPAAGLILQNPPALRSLILRRFGWWNLWLVAGPIALQVPKELDGPTTGAKVRAPAIFILAEDDPFVVPSNQQRVVNAFAGLKRIVTTTGGHSYSMTPKAAAQLQQELDWLWTQARLPTPEGKTQ